MCRQRHTLNHADYPHEPGTLYDCRACEAECHCGGEGTCVHCAITAESDKGGEMAAIRLPHSGLVVPTEQVRVTQVSSTDIGTGIAWSGMVRDGRTLPGAFTNGGRGGPTQFQAADAAGARRMREFIAACRTADGDSADEEAVGEALTDEHETSKAIAAAHRRGRTLIRHYDDFDIPGFWESTADPDRPVMVRALATECAARHPSVVRAELWDATSRAWIEFYRRTD